MAKVSPLRIIPPFLAGKFISDAVMLLTGRYAVSNGATFVKDIVSVKGVTMSAVGLLLMGAVLFLDWRRLLEKKQVHLNFKIWK